MKKILVVEDNRLERRLIMHILHDAFGDQIQIDEAKDGHIAIENISGIYYDLVITDLIMPKIEGLELISTIKSKYPSINNILAVSGGNPYYLYLAKKMGVSGIFTKPLDKEKFIQSVQNMLKTEPQNSLII